MRADNLEAVNQFNCPCKSIDLLLLATDCLSRYADASSADAVLRLVPALCHMNDVTLLDNDISAARMEFRNIAAPDCPR